jgi:glycosyltransferase involved in cell wall biosynthesis
MGNERRRPLRVLHLNDCSNVAKSYMQFLPKDRVHCELYMPTVGTYRASKATRALLPLIRMMESTTLLRRFREGGFDLVHVHYVTFAIMPMLARLPFVVHAHGADLNRDVYRPYFGSIVKAGLARARAAMYVTPDLRRHIASLRPDARFLPNPVDLQKFAPDDAIAVEQPSILVISKLDRQKGLQEFLQAIDAIWSVRPDVKVGMFRFGNAADAVSEFFERHRANPALHLLSPVPHAEMAKLINSYSIVLGQQGGNIATFGLSELEAMACGKPVVVRSDYGDAYPEPPPLLHSPDVDAIVRHLTALVENPQRGRELGVRAREWVSKYHDGTTQAGQLADIYAAAVGHDFPTRPK